MGAADNTTNYSHSCHRLGVAKSDTRDHGAIFFMDAKWQYGDTEPYRTAPSTPGPETVEMRLC